MVKKVLLMFLFTLFLHGSEFADKSTQELLSIIGYTDTSKLQALKEELKKRYPDMSESEKKQYEEKRKELEK